MNGGKRYSLAAVQADQRVVIQRILFPDLAEFCAAVGIGEGSVVQCRAASPRQLFLANGDGRTVAFERDRARFVQVMDEEVRPEQESVALVR